MEPFYFWIDEKQVKFEKEGRTWTSQKLNPLITNYDDHVNNFDEKYHIPIPLKDHYKNYEPVIKFNNNNPIIIISNKYNIEWDKGYYNYIDINTLKILFNILKDKYNIIYLCTKKNIKSFSYDHNLIDNELDHDSLSFNENCIYFEDYIEKNNLDYNLTKCITFSHCENYIGVQGGGSYLISYFYRNLIIYHLKGREIIL